VIIVARRGPGGGCGDAVGPLRAPKSRSGFRASGGSRSNCASSRLRASRFSGLGSTSWRRLRRWRVDQRGLAEHLRRLAGVMPPSRYRNARNGAALGAAPLRSSRVSGPRSPRSTPPAMSCPSCSRHGTTTSSREVPSRRSDRRRDHRHRRRVSDDGGATEARLRHATTLCRARDRPRPRRSALYPGTDSAPARIRAGAVGRPVLLLRAYLKQLLERS
jgi:hypothetical protein